VVEEEHVKGVALSILIFYRKKRVEWRSTKRIEGEMETNRL
jgi:hypothetical protein